MTVYSFIYFATAYSKNVRNVGPLHEQ